MARHNGASQAFARRAQNSGRRSATHRRYLLRALLERGRRPPRWGNLRRLDPFSRNYGFERGTPIDRVWINRHVAAHAELIHGDVLEVQDSQLTDRFGGSAVRTATVLDIDPDNRAATIVGDLSLPDTLPEAAFDCVLLIQTLQYVSDVDSALRTAWKS